jgi:1-aminocyclopropane-1-carboxylate deaminase
LKNQKTPRPFVPKLDSWITELIRKSTIEPLIIGGNTTALELFVKRDDLIHPLISGNKIRKLRYNLLEVFTSDCEGIITYGGAYSNHLLATASAGHELGIPVIGKVRGEELNVQSNSLLSQCHSLGMDLRFLARSTFTEEKHQSGRVEFEGEFYWVIPEGGANAQGIQGCTEIVSELNETYDYYIVAQGTCTTSLGLLVSIPENAKLIVVPVLKGFDVLKEMRSLLNDDVLFDVHQSKLIIWDNYHHGGYGKSSAALDSFISEFHSLNTFHIEPVYTGKVFYALNNEISEGNVNFAGKNVLVVHTGGVWAE